MLKYATSTVINAALRSRCGYYILSCFFFLLLSFFFHRLISSRRLDVYHTSTHGVALVRIYNAGLKCAARGSLEMQDPKNRQKITIWAPSHTFDGLYLRNEGTHRQPEKQLLNSNVSPICPHNMANFGPLVAEILSLVWGTPANFNGFRVLAAILYGI